MTRPHAPSPSEAGLQARILKHLNDLPRCWAVKFPGVLRRGVPDVLVCYRGRFVAIEIKRPGQSPTKLQRAVIQQIQDASGIADVVCALDEVRAILLEIDEELALERFGE